MRLVFSLLTLFSLSPFFRIEFFSPPKYNKLSSLSHSPRAPIYPSPRSTRASFFFSLRLASNWRAGVRTRPGTRKASRVPSHAYCRALLIGPDPGGMKYKNRNKAPLPVPGEMLRYRIRDSAGAPSRARKQTQRNPAAAAVAAAAPVLSALTARVSFFFLPPSIECRPPARLWGELQAVASEGKNGRNCELSAIFPAGWKFRDYRWERRETARLLYPAICSFEFLRDKSSCFCT